MVGTVWTAVPWCLLYIGHAERVRIGIKENEHKSVQREKKRNLT
jgi:hypothetical protein